MTSRRNALLSGLVLAATPALPLAASASTRIVADEFWADKGGVRLWVYRKRLEGARSPVRLLCVHRRFYSGKTILDLQVPGRDYSVMDDFAGLGYVVGTMDHAGYPHSQQTAG